MTQIRIRFRRRTNFYEDVSSIFQLDSMRAPDTRSVEQVAAELATQMCLAKLIHHPSNQYGTVGSEAVQLDERRFPSIKILLDCCSGVVDDSHVATFTIMQLPTSRDRNSQREASRSRLVHAAPCAAIGLISTLRA